MQRNENGAIIKVYRNENGTITNAGGGDNVKINSRELNIALARACKSLSDLRGEGVSPQTLIRIRKGISVKPVTAGKIAKALGVDPAELIETEEQ